MVEAKVNPVPNRLPSLDGWRAVSILLVVLSHWEKTFDYPQAAKALSDAVFDAALGVRFFFVLSGFLITRLLLLEHVRTGGLSLKGFYVRRALRIFPVYFAYLAVVLALQILTPARQSLAAWVGCLTFSANYFQRPFFTFHFWTLAVEEQFYLIWPAVLVWAGLGKTRRLLCILAAPILLDPICKLIYSSGNAIFLPTAFADKFFGQFSSVYYFDSLAVGCLAAILEVRYSQELKETLARFGLLIAVSGVVLILAPAVWLKVLLWGLTDPDSKLALKNAPFVTITGSFLQSAGFAALMLESVRYPQYFKALNWRIVREIGVLSYSIYIWQMLFCTDPRVFGRPGFWLMSWKFCLAPILVVAAASYYLFEKPLMKLRAKFRPAGSSAGRDSVEPTSKTS